jgi:DnaJ-class molecular chaperone
MTLRGQGNVGPRGGPRGDIVVLFEVEEDPRFERDARTCTARCWCPTRSSCLAPT